MKKIFVLTILLMITLSSGVFANNSFSSDFENGIGGIPKLSDSDIASMKKNLESLVGELSKQLNSSQISQKQGVGQLKEYKFKSDKKNDLKNYDLESIKQIKGLTQKELENFDSKDLENFFIEQGLDPESLFKTLQNAIQKK
jgi:preprotein translocase subunit SecD